MNQELPLKDFDWLRGEIQRRFESLSPHLQRIAEYALAEPNRFALQTIAKSAAGSGVQPSSIVRFAKLFGYSGFSDMQQTFRLRLAEVVDALSNQVREPGAMLDAVDDGDPKSLLGALSDASATAIERLNSDMDRADLMRAEKMLRRAQAIGVLGQRQAFPVAACLSLGLLKLGRRCQLLDSTAGMLPHQIAGLTRDDLLIVIGLSDFSRATLESVPEACRRGVPVLSISNNQTNPLARNSTLNLVVRDSIEPDFEPLAPYIVLAQTLVAAMALIDGVELETEPDPHPG